MPRLQLLPPAEVAETPEEAAPIINYLMNRGGPLAIDTETTGLHKFKDHVLYWSMATESRRYCFPASLLLFFDPLFLRKDITWYLANAKYDMHMLDNMGVKLHGPKWDIVVMDAMADDTRAHGLKEQADEAYGVSWGDFKDLFLDPDLVAKTLSLDPHAFRAFKKKSNGEKLMFMYHENPDIVIDYASCDAFFTYMRAEDLAAELAAEELMSRRLVPGMPTLQDYFETIEVPLTDALWRMERNGFPVDLDYRNQIRGPILDGLAASERRIRRIAGGDFNPSSTEELRDILFSKQGFGLKPVKYTSPKSGAPKKSTDEKTLQVLLGRTNNDTSAHQFLDALLKYRNLKKIYGTYVEKLEDKYVYNGKVHCSINQAGARTSRFSSSNPNMQNIPARNDVYKIRGIFTAEQGRSLVDLDYPQIEFRIAAVLAGEKKMLEAFRQGWDIHCAKAANMYPDATYESVVAAKARKENNEDLSDIDKRMLQYRAGAKTVGLGTLYGEGPKKMADQLGITVDDARELIDTFFNTNRRISHFTEYMKQFAHENGFTYTMLGRVRRLHNINNDYQRKIVAAEERQSVNSSVQGSGAEMMKLAILRVDADPRFQELGGKLLMTVHDELISSAPDDTAQEVYEIKKELMADPYRWGPINIDYPVPVTPDGSVAKRWSEAK